MIACYSLLMVTFVFNLSYDPKYNIQDIIGSNVDSHINHYGHNLVEDYHLHMAHFVRELVSLREHTLELSNSVIWSRDELDKLIHDVCTC